jgi:hypothetical protein
MFMYYPCFPCRDSNTKMYVQKVGKVKSSRYTPSRQRGEVEVLETGASRWWVVSVIPRPLYPRKRKKDGSRDEIY